MLMLVAALALFVGAALTLRYKAIVLVPASGACVTLTIAGVIVRGGNFSVTVIAVVVSLTCMQIGFLGASAILSFLTHSRITHPKPSAIGRHSPAH
jgi:hypothetical protein